MAFIEALIDDLDMGAERPRSSLRLHLGDALQAFAEGRDLGPATEQALQVAGAAMDVLESTGDETRGRTSGHLPLPARARRRPLGDVGAFRSTCGS